MLFQEGYYIAFAKQQWSSYFYHAVASDLRRDASASGADKLTIESSAVDCYRCNHNAKIQNTLILLTNLFEIPHCVRNDRTLRNDKNSICEICEKNVYYSK